MSHYVDHDLSKVAPDVCIYHADCLDGFTAAWAVRSYFPHNDIQFIEGFYGKPTPDVTGKNVVLVDFSYPADELRYFGERNKCVLVLDHHKTAEADLKEFAFDSQNNSFNANPYNVVAIFDQQHSGAVMAWHYFHGTEPPFFLKCVEDCDLFRFAIPESKYVCAYANSYNYTFESFDLFIEDANDRNHVDRFVSIGGHFDRLNKVNAARMIKSGLFYIKIGGYDVPVVNAPRNISSMVANKLVEMFPEAPFGATYFDLTDFRQFNLRSAQKVGLDVSEIAKNYDGGGHRHASGFVISKHWLGDK